MLAGRCHGAAPLVNLTAAKINAMVNRTLAKRPPRPPAKPVFRGDIGKKTRATADLATHRTSIDGAGGFLFFYCIVNLIVLYM